MAPKISRTMSSAVTAIPMKIGVRRKQLTAVESKMNPINLDGSALRLANAGSA
ncbi:hypothetical protein D3C72_2568510 [compost metagenome]